ncbi:hypothetical protein Gekk315_00076 [Aeromonas phage Gekk3-15]
MAIKISLWQAKFNGNLLDQYITRQVGGDVEHWIFFGDLDDILAYESFDAFTRDCDEPDEYYHEWRERIEGSYAGCAEFIETVITFDK